MTLTEFHELAVSVCRKYMPEIDVKQISVVSIISYQIISHSCSCFDGNKTVYSEQHRSPSAALSALEAELQKRNALNNISKQQEDVTIT